MNRSTGTLLGFVLLLLLAVAFGWVLYEGRAGDVGDPTLQAAEAEPALVWPGEMSGPITDYMGRRVVANGLTVTSVDADEGFWVQKDGRRAWVQIETATESPYTVRPGDVVSLTGQVLPHGRAFPSQVYFCPDRTASATELSNVPAHFAVRVDAVSFGVG